MLHQRDRLIDELADALQPRDDVLVVLTRCGRHLRNEHWDILLDALDIWLIGIRRLRG